MLVEFSFLKLDVAGHSKMLADNPRVKVAETLDKLEAYVDEAASRGGGRLWTWQGDGGLAAFLGDDSSANALECGLRIVNNLESFNRSQNSTGHKVAVRIAIHRGAANYRPDTGRIHSEDLNFVSHMEDEFAFPNDVCISDDAYRELDELDRRQFKETGVFQQKTVYSMQQRMRDKAVIHVDHLRLPSRRELLRRNLRSQLRIFSTTADNYFADETLLVLIRERMSRDGCKVRVLLLDPDSPFFVDRERQEQTHFKERQTACIANLTDLKRDFPGQTAVHLFDCAPTYQSLLVDDSVIFVAINLFGVTGTTQFPCLQITNGPDTCELFEKFTGAFEDLWNESKKLI